MSVAAAPGRLALRQGAPQRARYPRRMDLALDILMWSGVAAVALAVAGMLVVAALAWLLNHPVDEDGEEGVGRC